MYFKFSSTHVGSLGSSERKLILKNSTNAVYSPPGFLLFQRNGNLMAQPFDAQRLELSGAPTSIAEEVATYNVWQRALFSTSNSGHLAFLTRIDRLLQPVWTDRSGKILEPLSEPWPSSGVIFHTMAKRSHLLSTIPMMTPPIFGLTTFGVA